MVFLGMKIDTINEVVRIPREKITLCVDEIKRLLACKKATLKEIQSVVGLLNFFCQVIVPGRAFLRRLIDLTWGIKRACYRLRIKSGAK
jgi:hypothetical protein